MDRADLMRRARRGEVRITAVAIMLLEDEVVSLPEPNRHVNVMLKIAADRPGWSMRRGDEQGFLTDCGAFVSRRQAEYIAYRSGQAKKGARQGHVFTSEELW